MSDLGKREEELAKLEVQDEIEDRKVSISQKKALEREARQKYGRNWKSILGLTKHLKVDEELIHTMYGCGLGDLRELSKPSSIRRA